MKIEKESDSPSPYFPEWAKSRLGWNYAGWIQRDSPYDSFDELCKHAIKTDHGEIRELDFYPEGAVAWCKEL